MHAAENNDVDIISMSLGIPPVLGSSTQLIDFAVDFASENGKLIFAAAGTGAGWGEFFFDVPFPANHPAVHAISGIRSPNNPTGPLNTNDNFCTNCITGPEIEFVVIMQRPNNGQFANSEMRTIPTLGCFSSTIGYSNGSSCATASQAGIAALIWDQLGSNSSSINVFSTLVNFSSNLSSPVGDFGFGWVNVDQATQ